MIEEDERTSREFEWFSTEDPSLMLKPAHGMPEGRRWYERKRPWRLLAVGCCRRVWQWLSKADRRVVLALETHAEGARRLPEANEWINGNVVLAACGEFAFRAAEQTAAYAAATYAGETAGYAPHSDQKKWQAAEAVERREQCKLIRCIFGNPFRPHVFDPSWRSEAAVALARGIYEARAFDRMPVLADALEDAGCSDAAVLAHCRDDGPHARGCWVVDAVLGMS